MSTTCREVLSHPREACGPECVLYDVTDESPCLCGHGLGNHVPAEYHLGGRCVVEECGCTRWRDAGER